MRRLTRAIPALWILPCLLALVSSCDHSHSHSGHSHGHGHSHGSGHSHDPASVEEIPVQVVTRWEDGIEAFLEYEAPVAGEPVRFIVHISHLDDGTPKTEGPVVFELTDPSGVKSEQVAAEPARDGVYLPELTFPSPGAWKAVIRVRRGEERVHRVSLPDVVVHATGEEARNSLPSGEVEGIAFLKEQQWLLSTVTEPARRASLSEQRSFPGHIHERAGHRVTLSSPLIGRLLRREDGRLPDRGTHVEAGEVLARVQPTLPTANLLGLIVKVAEVEAELHRDRQALELARLALARAEELEKSGGVSRQDLEKIRYEHEVARVAYQASEATRESYQRAIDLGEARREEDDAGAPRLGPIDIVTPISGTVVDLEAVPGEVVDIDEPIFVVLDASRLTVEARITQHEAEDVPPTPRARLKLDEGYAGKLESVPLELFYSGLEIEEETHTIPLLYEVDNDEGLLRVGMICEVLVEIAPPRETLSIPLEALVDEDGAFVAYVQVSGETFEKRTLQVGIRGEERVEILKGLGEGERVVVRNPWAIRLASMSTAIPAHEH